MTHSDFLRQTYEVALGVAFTKKTDFNSLDEEVKRYVDYIVSRSESNKGMVTVLTTLLAHKAIMPGQDIRIHQAGMPGGFSGRVIDKSEVTPFMKSVSFPAMAESGWLTRSLEKNEPYTLDYKANFADKNAKAAFLNILDRVQAQGVSSTDVLRYFFVMLIRQRDSRNVKLAKPHNLSIATIIALLEKHFTAKYLSAGASRLPTLAIYAAYRCMTVEVARYKDKVLCPLESHNSSDAQSGRIGDIDVNNIDGTAYEGVEIKHGIVITPGLVTDAYEKFKVYNTDRYYLLTTADMDGADWNGINAEITRISQIHGCQVIVNGVYATLKYYLRLLSDAAEFVDCYVECMKTDETVKFQHKTMWNDVVGER